jgi:hypothetical protein
METRGPHVRTIPVHWAPAKPPARAAASSGGAKATHDRRVRTLAYKALTQQSTLMSLLGQGPSRRDRAVVAAPQANYDHDQYRRPTLP